jgi:guanylate kinase
MLLVALCIATILVVGLFVRTKFFGKPKRARSKVDAIVISGPSGAGKGTIIKRLMSERPGTFAFCVSHTSRAPREGEANGHTYHFVSKETMEGMVSRGEFLECCEVHGNMYGTSKQALKAVQSSGKVPIVEVDVQGAQKLKKHQGNMNFYYVFIAAPSMDELTKRIESRGADGEDRKKIRIETARKEMEFMESHRSFFDKVLVNSNIDESLAILNRLFKLYCGL